MWPKRKNAQPELLSDIGAGVFSDGQWRFAQGDLDPPFRFHALGEIQELAPACNQVAKKTEKNLRARDLYTYLGKFNALQLPRDIFDELQQESKLITDYVEDQQPYDETLVLGSFRHHITFRPCLCFAAGPTRSQLRKDVTLSCLQRPVAPGAQAN